MSDDRAPGKTPPYLLTTRDMIRIVAERWNRTFGKYPDRSWQRDAGARLAALDRETATREDVKEIVENDGWVKLTCDQCGQDVDTVIVVGETVEWRGESCTVDLCSSCTHKAAKLFFGLMLGSEARALAPESLADQLSSKARTRELLLMVPYNDALKIARTGDLYIAQLETMLLERASPQGPPAGAITVSASESGSTKTNSVTSVQAGQGEELHYVRGYYPFAYRKLSPDEHAELSLKFQLPFRLDTLVASANDAAGIVVKDILVGARSAITSGNVMPIEMFYPSRRPLAFSVPEVPVDTPLRVLVQNTSDKDRTLRMGVFGNSVSENSPEASRSATENR